MNTELPMPTAPMASGLSRPTINVSTIPIVIQPSSARTTGSAKVIIGLNSSRRSLKRGNMHFDNS